MAGSVNKVILIGNLGNDPEIRVSQDGKKMATLSLATSESWRDKNTNEKQERTEWHRIVIFSPGLADIAEKYCKKGSKLYIEGQLQTRKYNDQAGIEKYSTEVILQGFSSTLTMLDSKSSFDNSIVDSSISKNTNQNAPDNITESSKNLEIDDEIPF